MTFLKVNHPVQNSFSGLIDSLFNDIPATLAKTENDSTSPLVNISETTDSYLIEVNAPGRNKENFQLKLDKNLLTVSYEAAEQKAEDNRKSIRREFTSNNFKRTFTVDEKIATDNIQARYENGILLVTLPKKEEVKVSPKQITIQ